MKKGVIPIFLAFSIESNIVLCSTADLLIVQFYQTFGNVRCSPKKFKIATGFPSNVLCVFIHILDLHLALPSEPYPK